jgi:hypothetical protein
MHVLPAACWAVGVVSVAANQQSKAATALAGSDSEVSIELDTEWQQRSIGAWTML